MEKNEHFGLRRISAFGEYACFFLGLWKWFGWAANLLVYIEGHNAIHVDIDI